MLLDSRQIAATGTFIRWIKENRKGIMCINGNENVPVLKKVIVYQSNCVCPSVYLQTGQTYNVYIKQQNNCSSTFKIQSIDPFPFPKTLSSSGLEPFRLWSENNTFQPMFLPKGFA
jgi:hypothetical protein